MEIHINDVTYHYHIIDLVSQTIRKQFNHLIS